MREETDNFLKNFPFIAANLSKKKKKNTEFSPSKQYCKMHVTRHSRYLHLIKITNISITHKKNK